MNKRLILFLQLGLSVSSICFAQISISHTSTIADLTTDSIGNLLMVDVKGKVYDIGKYQWNNTTARPHSKPILPRSADELNLASLASVKLAKGKLISTDDGLWYSEGTGLKRYYSPGVSFPPRITQMGKGGAYISMLSDNEVLHVYDIDRQLLAYVDKEVRDFVFDKWNCLWYLKGNQVHTYQQLVNKELPLITDLVMQTADQQKRPPPYHLASDEQGVQLSWTGTYAPLYNDLKYAYRTEGADWVALGKQSQLRLDFLSPGRHQIYIKAIGLNGADAILGPIEIAIKDKGLDRFFPWVMAALGGLLLLALYGRQRSRNELVELEKEKDKIKLTLEAALQKQKLGQTQMNPHFIFNALNGISGLISLDRPKEARRALNKFAQLMRTVLDQSRVEAISIVQEKQFIDDYLSLEKLIRNEHFEYELVFEVDDNILIPPMIIQPFLENAIIHGFKNLPRKGFLSVVATDKGRHVQVRVTDNGQGRAYSAEHSTKSHESAALSIIEQRLKLIDKWSDMSLQYEDLEDEEGKPNGTSVILKLPKMNRV